MPKYVFELDISPEELSDIEKAYGYYGLSVRDVIEILLKKSLPAWRLSVHASNR